MLSNTSDYKIVNFEPIFDMLPKWTKKGGISMITMVTVIVNYEPLTATTAIVSY